MGLHVTAQSSSISLHLSAFDRTFARGYQSLAPSPDRVLPTHPTLPAAPTGRLGPPKRNHEEGKATQGMPRWDVALQIALNRAFHNISSDSGETDCCLHSEEQQQNAFALLRSALDEASSRFSIPGYERDLLSPTGSTGQQGAAASGHDAWLSLHTTKSTPQQVTAPRAVPAQRGGTVTQLAKKPA